MQERHLSLRIKTVYYSSLETDFRCWNNTAVLSRKETPRLVAKKALKAFPYLPHGIYTVFEEFTDTTYYIISVSRMITTYKAAQELVVAYLKQCYCFFL